MKFPTASGSGKSSFLQGVQRISVVTTGSPPRDQEKLEFRAAKHPVMRLPTGSSRGWKSAQERDGRTWWIRIQRENLGGLPLNQFQNHFSSAIINFCDVSPVDTSAHNPS
jgi:hypothetical protein